MRGYDPAALTDLEGMHLFDALRAMLKTGREPPLAPPTFAKALRARVASGELSFSSEADLDVVIGMYQNGFISLFEKCTRTARERVTCSRALTDLAHSEEHAVG